MYVNFSKLGSLKLSDFWKGFILTCITAALTVIQQSWSNGITHIDWGVLATTTGTVAIAYLLKNLGTGAGGQLLTNEPPKPKINIPDVK